MMSSNGLWKMTNQTPSVLEHHAQGLSSENSLRIASQDEPIDFSQKSESTTPGDASITENGEIRKKIKTENGIASQNGFHPNYTDFAAQFYHIRNKTISEQNAIFESFANNAYVQPQTRDSSPKVENGNLSAYFEAIRSCSRSDVTSSRESPKSPETDAHRSNLSSPPSLETDSNLGNGRGQVGSPEAKTKSAGVCNDEGLVSPQVRPHFSYFKVPSTSEVTPLTGDHVPFLPGGIGNVRMLEKLPQLTIPIMNPLNVRKSNGFSPGTPTAASALPFHAALSPPATTYEDQMRVAQLSQLWKVGSPYMQNSILQAQLEDKKPTKHIRPFKAYSNDIINSCQPGMRAASMGSFNNFDRYVRFPFDNLDQTTKTPNRAEVGPKKVDTSELPSPSDTTKYDCQSTTSTTNACGEPSSSSPEIKRTDSNGSSPPNEETQQQLPSDNSCGRKRGNRYPENEKDPAYWERRKKNNEAAKRSRDARRRKEDALAMSAKELLDEKIKLSMHLSFQMNEMKKLKEEVGFLKETEMHLKTYIYHLENRCRDCTLCNNKNPKKHQV